MCHNVPIARTGWYEYVGKELGLEDRQNEIIKVYRNPEEVFNEKSIASFEGKIVTDEHPPKLLTPENAQRYSKGVVQNVRQCKEETDLLLADLMIHDQRLIDEIQDGKREVSCGYDYVRVDNGDGTFSQTEIRGNHVAVVEAGRAGIRVSIKDSNKEVEENKMGKKITRPRKNTSTSRFLQALGLKQFAMDAEAEELADTVDEIVEENKATDGLEDGNEQKKPDTSAVVNDEGGNQEIAALAQQVAKLTEIVMQAIKPQQKAPEDALDEFIKEIGANDDDLDSKTIEMDGDISEGAVSNPEDRPKNPIEGTDSMITALRAMKPIIAKIPDEADRKQACDSLISEFRQKMQKTNKDGYKNIIESQRKTAKDNEVKHKNPALDPKYIDNLGEDIAKRFNINLKGGK